MLAYMFPGQGAQVSGMGQAHFSSYLYPAALERELDEIAGFSIRKMCLEAPDEALRDTAVTQPCLYVVNALSYLATADARSPDYLLGHSLGEYSALWAAGSFDLATGLRIVRHRGQLMKEAPQGGMCAVIGLEASAIQQVLDEASLTDIDIANLNTRLQIVISGPKAALAAAVDPLEDAGGAVRRLSVGAAFHSRYMADAAARFMEFLQPFDIQPPKIQVVSNVTGHVYPPRMTAADMVAMLGRQITSQVRWGPSIERLHAAGVTRFVEVGPGLILSRMMADILPARFSRAD